MNIILLVLECEAVLSFGLPPLKKIFNGLWRVKDHKGDSDALFCSKSQMASVLKKNLI